MSVTNIEQSKSLLELGLGQESADMVYYYPYKSFERILRNKTDSYLMASGDIPAWTLEALLEVMPKDIRVYTQSKGTFNPCVFKSDKNLYWCIYVNGNLDLTWEGVTGKSYFEAVYNMVVWLLKNNYIKTSKSKI